MARCGTGSIHTARDILGGEFLQEADMHASGTRRGHEPLVIVPVFLPTRMPSFFIR